MFFGGDRGRSSGSRFISGGCFVEVVGGSKEEEEVVRRCVCVFGQIQPVKGIVWLLGNGIKVDKGLLVAVNWWSSCENPYLKKYQLPTAFDLIVS